MPRYNFGSHNGKPVVREYSGHGSNISIRTVHSKSRHFDGVQRRLELLNKYKTAKAYYSEEIKRRHLILPSDFKFISDLSEYVGNTWEQQNHSSNVLPNTSEYYDDFGFKVRSRGEMIIGNALKTLGLEAKYEPLITLKSGKKKNPDYSFPVRIIDRCFYIEFMGMTDDNDYINYNYGKIDEYMRSGILPNRDLILICGTKDWLPSQSEVMRIIASFINNAVLRTYNRKE